MASHASLNGSPAPVQASPVPSTSNGAASSSVAQAHSPFYAELANHLLAGWSSAQFSDSQLHCQYADGTSGIYHMHSLIVSQSPVLRSLLHTSRPVILLPLLDPSITSASLGLCLASLYSPSVLSHLSASTAPSILATASFLGLDRLAALAFETCEATVAAAKTPDEVASWIAYVERERGPAFHSVTGSPATLPSSPISSGPGGPTPPASVNGKAAAPAPGGYEARLRARLFERIVCLPKELGAFDAETAAQTQPQLIDVLKRLPFDLFKAVVEDSNFDVPSDMDRFNFAKKAIAARKALAQQAGALEFEETVVLQFGAAPDGTAVSVLRKGRKPQLWKIGPGI
ncbi:hypothetical protein JCM10207_005388 [Rhodosporidiobolus poonsookiae]